MEAMSVTQFETDFDLDTDAKAPPVIPQGNYRGSVTGVTFDGEKQSINFDVVLQGNDMVMTDGETPVDGAKLSYRIWLPRAEDADQLTSSGNQTKAQWKINNLKKVSTSLGINMTTPKAIAEGLNNGDWIGIEVIANIKISEWQGDIRNEINSLIAAP
jgi:hypothetical protein